MKILEIDLRVFLKVSQISGTGQVIEFHSSVNSRLSYEFILVITIFIKVQRLSIEFLVIYSYTNLYSYVLPLKMYSRIF